MRGIVIAGTHSGCGKTTITLGILAALKKKGYKVQPFKAGPDFIDTGLHGLITGRRSRNLDLWICGRDYVIDSFNKHSADADIAVVEGVMGMYDGNLSTADLAAALGLPVILVVDAYGMAESAGAVVKGFIEYRHPSLLTGEGPGGVIFNRVASDRHYGRLRDSVDEIPVLGYLPRKLDFKIPHRHLGLVVAEENPIDSKEIDKLADAILENVDIDGIVRDDGRGRPMCLPENVKAPVRARSPRPCNRSADLRIAVASDKAFCFYYEDNLDLMRDAGAEIVKFSPLSDGKIPDGADALYIGGGYPELYAGKLSENRSMLESVKDFSDKGMPVYAECGGFMYLTEGIHDFDNVFYPMAGVFPFSTKMTKGRARLGYREVILREDSIIGKKGVAMRGHEFHYSEIVDENGSKKQEAGTDGAFIPPAPRPFEPLNPDLIYSVKDGSGAYIFDEGFRVKNTVGSYIHLHFGSNNSTAENFIGFIEEHNGKDSHCGTR
ncbi:MAG: cobyrinate a,c-diamide synthase [Nitrospirota bacterium]|nr:cobyrinate a,c-diamide synthase [Nitrospirota bacterium]